MSRERVVIAVIAAFAGGQVSGMLICLRARVRLPGRPDRRRKAPVPAPLPQANVIRLADHRKAG
jgi:hypothetical protein